MRPRAYLGGGRFVSVEIWTEIGVGALRMAHNTADGNGGKAHSLQLLVDCFFASGAR